MKIYNEDKTKVLNEEKLDLEKGRLVEETLVTHVPYQQGEEEIGHYVTIKEYENGGKDIEWVVDKEAIPDIEEHDEEEQIKVYIPYTKEELKEIEDQKRKDELYSQLEEKQEEMESIKQTLAETDYKVLKFIEGYISQEEFEEIKEYREHLREQIRIKEEEIDTISNLIVE